MVRVVLAVLVTATAAFAAVARDQEPAAEDAAASRPITEVPPLPESTGLYGSAISVIGGRLHVATRTKRDAENAMGVVRVWSLSASGWDAVGGPVEASIDHPMHLLDVGRPCLTRRTASAAEVVCLDDSNGWEVLDKPLAVSAGPDDSRSIGDIEVHKGQIFAVVNGIARGRFTGGNNVGVIGRSRSRVWRYLGSTGWQPFPKAAVPTRKGGSSQRPYLAVRNGHPCVAHNAAPGPRANRRIPEVRIYCERSGGWQPVGNAVRSRKASMLDTDGLVISRGRLVVGTDEFGPGRQVRWRVREFRAGRWRLVALPRTDRRWRSQGVLAQLGQALWGLQFDQRTNARHLLAQVQLRRLGPAMKRSRPVGAPLIDDEPLYAPIELGLTEMAGDIYVLHTKPSSAQRQNVTKVTVVPVANR